MKLSELREKIGFESLAGSDYPDRDITGCYIGDLLSRVMSRAESGNVWITIMNNINITAVASLTDVACIILCEGVSADENVISKANEENIVILKSDKSAYELACALNGEI